MQAHPHQIVTQGALIDTVVKPLEPAIGVLVVKDLVLGSARLSLSFPIPNEQVFVKSIPGFLGPLPQRLAAGPVQHSEAAQLAELLRELWDFR
jgi:hypothetical protein